MTKRIDNDEKGKRREPKIENGNSKGEKGTKENIWYVLIWECIKLWMWINLLAKIYK